MKSAFKIKNRNEAPASYTGLPGDAELVNHVHYVSHWRLGTNKVRSALNFHCDLHANAGIMSRLIQAIFMMPGYMARQQEELYEKMMKRADEICARGNAMNDDANYDDDLPSTSTVCSADNGKEIDEAAPEEGAKALEPVPIIDNAAPLEVKKVN